VLSETEILDFLETRLAVMSCRAPSTFRDSLPGTSTGKVIKAELRKWALGVLWC
jgi:acyl-CoA synthetase (AMP-forming)/AMP-acid ligase II